MARPSKLTADVQDRIVEALKLGATFELAAQYGGVSYHSFNLWRKRGAAELERVANARKNASIRESERPYVEFYEATKKAEGEAAVAWLERIEQAARDGAWQAAAWKLERRYPQQYGRTVTEHQGGDPERPIPITFIAVPAKPKKKDEPG